MTEVRPTARPKPTRRAVALVVVIDLCVATAVGVGVYFATRRFGPPTAPRAVHASATLCLPDECEGIEPTVRVSWSPPLAGGAVTRYVVSRDGVELEWVGARATGFLDPKVILGERYEYEISAIGDEGRGPPSQPASTEVPLPPLEHARLSGTYDVTLTFRRIDLLTRFQGVDDPAIGDRAFQSWVLTPECVISAGACDVRYFAQATLKRRGSVYVGPVQGEARCGQQQVRSTETLTLEATRAKVFEAVFIAVAIRGKIEVDFPCGGEKVHAVATVSGRAAFAT